MNRRAQCPLIFNVHRFALDDGPGIRTTVFLKGCPLRCVWCHNPESWSRHAEVAFYPERCIGCGDCADVCPDGAASMEIPGRIDRRKCSGCGICAERCPSTALTLLGRYYAVDELVELLLRDKIFYGTSDGGVTFSGGEPVLSMDYLREAAAQLKRHGVHIAIQTAGWFDLEEFRAKVMPYVDIVFYDIKLIDPVEHEHYTGKRNELILKNFIALVKEAGLEVIPRTPLVPGITDTPANLRGVAGLLKRTGCQEHRFLPYNPLGISKRQVIGEKTHSPRSLSVNWVDAEVKAESNQRKFQQIEK